MPNSVENIVRKGEIACYSVFHCYIISVCQNAALCGNGLKIVFVEDTGNDYKFPPMLMYKDCWNKKKIEKVAVIEWSCELLRIQRRIFAG